MSLADRGYEEFSGLLMSKGVTLLYAKLLAENDNRKNQVYLGRDFSAVQVLPNLGVVIDAEHHNFKAACQFFWLDDDGNLNGAPHAQMILYPDYPEVRLSGLLRGVSNPPSELMAARIPGRLLFLGVREDGATIGYVCTGGSALARAVSEIPGKAEVGVFLQLPLQAYRSPEVILLHELRRIFERGWIDSQKLNSEGLAPCRGQNCGGYTLEAELGIAANSRSEPDFLGYEVKQYRVRDFARLTSGDAITLMTPEPTGGIYREDGPAEFIRRFGHPDRKIDDRLNFSGVHKVGLQNSSTGLTLLLRGYDAELGRIVDVNGGITLLSLGGERCATWAFSDILDHWSRKHGNAVYVPSKNRKEPQLQYCFGHLVLLAYSTDPLLLFHALARGDVYYDPGLHLANASTRPELKRRNQFRVRPRNLSGLYQRTAERELPPA